MLTAANSSCSANSNKRISLLRCVSSSYSMASAICFNNSRSSKSTPS